MRMSKLMKALSLLIIGFLIISYQNCSSGFQAIESGSSSGASLENPDDDPDPDPVDDPVDDPDPDPVDDDDIVRNCNVATKRFLASSSNHTRDGLVMEQLAADKVYPYGRRPYIGAHATGIKDNEIADMGKAGFTIVGSYYGCERDEVARVRKAAAAGMQYIYPLVDTSSPVNDCGGTSRDRLGEASTNPVMMNQIKAAYAAHLNRVKADPVANEAVYAWGGQMDDHFYESAFRNTADTIFPYLVNLDPKHRGIIELPFFADKVASSRPYFKALFGHSEQNYVVNSFRTNEKTYIQPYQEKVFRKLRYNLINKNTQPHANGLPRTVINLTWGHHTKAGRRDHGTEAYSATKYADYIYKRRIAGLISNYLGDAHGFSVYQYRNAYLDLSEWNQIVRSFRDKQIPSMFLWGQQKGYIQDYFRQDDITRTPVGNWKFRATLLGPPYMVHSFSSKAAILTGGRGIKAYQGVFITAGTDKGRCMALVSNPTKIADLQCFGDVSSGKSVGANTDSIAWRNIQFKGNRYLVVMNTMPVKDVWEAEGGGVSPPPGQNGYANYTVTNKFKLPKDLQLTVVDLLTGEDAEKAGEYNPGTGEITVTLPPLGVRLYKIGEGC